MNNSSKTHDGRMDAVLDGQTAFVRVFGRATFTIASALKQFGIGLIEQQRITRLVLDTALCDTMDSTYVGVLTGLATRMKKHNGIGVYILNLSQKNFDILRTLGVIRLLDCHLVGDAPEDLRAALERQTAYGPVMRSPHEGYNLDIYEAHNDLVKADPANLMKFKDVLDYLREDLNNT